MIPAFLAVVPERQVWGLTHAGQLSMYIYLLHMWLMIPMIPYAGALRGGLYVLSAFLYALVLWVLLGMGCVRPCFKWCIEPRVDCFVQPWVMEEGKDQSTLAGPPVAGQPVAEQSALQGQSAAGQFVMETPVFNE